MSKENTYIVTIEVRTWHEIAIQAPCVAKAEKMANNLKTEFIRQNGNWIKSDHEVLKVVLDACPSIPCFSPPPPK